jgi:preprotein translocase subunit SecA
VVYKTEGFRLFHLLIDNIQRDAVRAIFRVQPVIAQQPLQTSVSQAETVTNAGEDTATANKPVRRNKVRPNDTCPCGSGKKYKHCHGSVRARQAASAI